MLFNNKELEKLTDKFIKEKNLTVIAKEKVFIKLRILEGVKTALDNTELRVKKLLEEQ